MADRKALRRFAVAGTTNRYAKGDTVSLPADEIANLERANLVGPMPAEEAPKSKSKKD